MGVVLRFPSERRPAVARDIARAAETGGSIVILPVVRIERMLDDDAGDQTQSSGPRRHGGNRRRGGRS